MGEGKRLKKTINQRIIDSVDLWKTPYNAHSVQRAKMAVLERISTKAGILEKVGVEERSAPIMVRGRSLSWLQVAAMALIIVSIPFVVAILGKVELINETRDYLSYQLPDGSKISAAPNAQLSYNEWIWSVNRHIDFSGAAFFDVRKGSGFSVKTEGGEVRVLGTRFSVWSSASHLLVHCNSGAVLVSNEASAVHLSANELTSSSALGQTLTVLPFSHLGALLPEASNELNCEGTPLAIVFAEIMQKTGLVIISDLDPELRYTGVLDLSDGEACFQILCKPFGATYHIANDGLVTLRK